MRAHVHAITLAVRDLDLSLRFYRALGLSSPGVIGTEFRADAENPGGAVAMFTMDNGVLLSLYGREDLARDAGVGLERMSGSAMSLGWFVDTDEAVGRVLEPARDAGATVPQPARRRPWGIHAGYFADPDGHLWEVVSFAPR
ncbi:VOC family protein [Nocardia spumae]|uniref:VOC family protein n=1 Tax=Nocardia spumae TaxID=2887190 RepID=UPI001D15A76A|nr:VOC family protein [Nocardia spumae]